jgi:phosphatidylserine/phosphatidylglycerophosphate/cardiolipin synthase-like enzyme
VIRIVFLFWFALAATAFAFEPPAKALPATGSVETAFSPGGAADRLIIEVIGQAKHEVLVQAYTFTHRNIASALIRAHRRGVDVQVIADAQQAATVPNTMVASLADAGIAVFLDAAHDAAHNKVIVIDPGTSDAALITGSYNFTYAAQTRNAENVLLIRGNLQLAARYADNWRRHREHSSAFPG